MICFALTLEHCQSLMPIFMKAYLWAPSSKSSLHWKQSTLRAWPDRPAWSLRTVHQAFGIHYSHCAGSQTSGGSSSPEHSLTSLRIIRNAEIPLPSPLKMNPSLALHHLRKMRSLSSLASFYGPHASAEQWKVTLFDYTPLNFSLLKVSILVTRRGKQGRGHLYFPSLHTWQSTCRFIFLTCGFVCQSKHITSNIGFGQNRFRSLNIL